MADNTEQRIRAELNETRNTLQRQRLLKALWRLQHPKADVDQDRHESKAA